MQKTLEIWQNDLEKFSISSLNQDKTLLVSVDMINGFCKFGNLYHQNCENIVKNVVDLMNLANKQNFKNYALITDSHTANSRELSIYPQHALEDSDEGESISEIENLSFFKNMKIFKKNSLSIAYNNEFNNFIKHFDNFIVFGVCTDLCVFATLFHLALEANEKNLQRRIIVPYNCVATYEFGEHKADFYQNFFLKYSKDCLGVEIYKEILK